MRSATLMAVGVSAAPGGRARLARVFALSMVALAFLFLFNDYLNYWWGWPSLPAWFGERGWFGLKPPRPALDARAITLGWLQLALYLASIAAVVVWVEATPNRAMRADADRLTALAAYIVRAAFWAVLLIGLADMVISMLRVEGFLDRLVGTELTAELGRNRFRGLYVHYPLIVVGLVIAAFTRSLGFTWLALLIVVAELQIVISRFVFSYEQAFMGDLVRFWYAALFLFASAYTLLNEGHVRIDILYTGFGERGKAWTNTLGALVLGAPLCWVILTQGLWNKASLINAPLLRFEVSQSGYGMYVKYLMAGFLLVYALSMMVQFMGCFLNSAAVLLREPDPRGDERTSRARRGMGGP